MTTKPPTNKPEPHWYVLETLAGQAAEVSESLRNSLPKLGIQGQVLEIRCPTQDPASVPAAPAADGQTPVPGYFLIKMVWNPQVWTKLRAHEGVTGFLGELNVPVPVTDTELAFVTRQMGRPRKTKKVIRISGEGHDQ
jgi:transcriptional antiterminator NusG